jgi:serine/threonine protein kinase
VQAAAREDALTEVARLDPRIRIERFVAEGGFGRVYKGHHRTLDRDVAVKVLKVPPEYGDVARAMFCERFAQEARIIARLDHPAVVRVLDFGVSESPGRDPAPYMILDWLDGVTLKTVIAERRREGGRFDRDETLQLLQPVMEAVAMAHARGIVHRDITPGNLMLVDTPNGPALRLLDFGIAKVMVDPHAEGVDAPEDTHTHTALLAFSPRWASPEQAGRGRTGPWTDVHALALLCTAMLTGERPYRGAREALFQSIFSETRPTPAAFGVDVGPWEPVLARALSLRPEARQPDAGALLRELQEALFASAPTRVVRVPASVLASVRTAPEAPQRRASTAWAVAGVLATLLAVGLAWGLWHAPSPTPATPTSAAPPQGIAPAALAPVAVEPPPAVQQLRPPPEAPAGRPAAVVTPPRVRRATTRPAQAPRPDEAPTPAAPPRAPETAPRPRIQPLRDYP